MNSNKKQKLNTEDYHFIKETIKKNPRNKKAIVCKVLGIMGGGLLFGIFAAAAFTLTISVFTDYFGVEPGVQEDIKITASEEEQTLTPADQDEEQSRTPVSDSADSKTGDTVKDDSDKVLLPLERYEQIYEQVLEVASAPRKAMVTISAMTETEDLLDESILSYGNAEGIVFLDNGSYLYILTNGNGFGTEKRLQVTFSDQSTAMGYLCKKDRMTGFAVLRVPASKISDATREEISVAKLDDSYSLSQAKPVIAIGNPAGDRDAVIYGMVTSVSSRLSVVDAEYNLLVTDIQGSLEGGGVLLNAEGSVIGVIVKPEGDDGRIVKALPISQMRPLIETLSNDQGLRYLGVRGVSITQLQADNRHIPNGVYVDGVENDSPAMSAGIQNGDIIKELDGNTIKNMQSYTTVLQKLTAGQRVTITLARKNSDGEYVDMDLEVIIEER